MLYLNKTSIIILISCLGFCMTSAAAPVNNDTIYAATQLTDSFSENIDTTEATAGAEDIPLNEYCRFPTTDASVWYEYTADSYSVVTMDFSGSSYNVGYIITKGSPDNLQIINCGMDIHTEFSTDLGSKYYIAAIDPNYDGIDNGGMLNVSFNKIKKPILDNFTVNKFGSFNAKTGVATISGTYTCRDGNSFSMYLNIKQNVGRLATINGGSSFYANNTCDGLSHPWSTEIAPLSGSFSGGKAATVSIGQACFYRFQCSPETTYEYQVILRH